MTKLTCLTFLCLVLCLASSIAGLAQSSRVLGTVSDTAEKKNLAYASVLLLRPSDSILVRYTRTDAAGRFTLNNIPFGRYLIVVTYPSYADFVDEVSVKDSVTLPVIGMVLKSKLLQEVVVSGNKGAIRLKGDTTEFNADSFRTQPNATVEDLLKKLPGIQVDKNGKITAQGQTVKKVLVDGEEFFGDDPTLVTQNLRADMVDKVQVYDKKSDQATFTGIDDGQRDKTINLKLKDGKKNGYFGRANAGQGTDGYYDYQLMANYFRNKEKLAGYGIISNTGKTGLGWGEQDTYGQSFAAGADVDENTGDISISSGMSHDELDSWSGRFEGQGYPSVKTGGLHYNNKFNDDQQSLNANYKYMMLNVTGSSTTNSQYILPDTFYYNNQSQQFRNQILRNSFSGIYEYKPDSTSSIKLMADGGTDHKTTNSIFHSEALASDSTMVNQNDRTTSTTGDKRTLNSNLLWRKKLAKKGRTISINMRENYTDNSSDGFLSSDTRLYDNGGNPFKDSLIDQYKNYYTKNFLLDTRATYTEPLSKSNFLSLNYGVTINNSRSNRNSYNKAAGGKYSQLDSLYSNDYQYNTFAHRAGLTYNFVKKKLRFSAGNDLGFTSWSQNDLHADTSFRRSFVNWYPNASVSYAFSSMRRLFIHYSGNTNQPGLQQIQPLRTNEDPLNITVGNPGLKPSFSNRLLLFYNNYNVLSDRGMYANLSYNFTENAIGSSVSVDSVGRRVSQFVNVDGNRSLFGYAGYEMRFHKPHINLEFYGNASRSTNVSVVNNLLNKTTSGTYGVGTSVGWSIEKKFDLSVRYSPTYTQSHSTINTGVTTQYWTHSIQPNLDFFFPLKLQLHADGDINLRQKTSVFDHNNNVVLLNAWLGRKFLKNDALLLKVAGNDLLNQNIGFNRTVNSNFITQNTYTTIQRYFMFSLVWNFTKPGMPAPPQRN